MPKVVLFACADSDDELASGALALRREARTSSADESHEPPRSTRWIPVAGPVGSVTGVDG